MTILYFVSNNWSFETIFLALELRRLVGVSFEFNFTSGCDFLYVIDSIDTEAFRYNT